MAQKAKKEQAKANAAALNNLHTGAAVVNGLFLAGHFLFGKRSVYLWLLLSIPSFLCELALERTGRPSYDAATRALRTPGEDLAAPGLTEYMFDVVWVTWAVELLVVFFGNRLWLLWLVIPAYGAYKGYGLVGAAKQMAGLPAGADAGAAPGPAGNRKQRRAA